MTRDDIELRPPLPAEHGPDVSHPYRHVLRDILCRMYVASEVMALGTEARFSSLVIFHRFACHYFKNVISDSEPAAAADGATVTNAITREQRAYLGDVASACIFLGCKTEEDTRRLRDVINLSHKLVFDGTRDHLAAATTPERRLTNTSPSEEGNVAIYERPDPPPLDNTYWSQKERIVVVEQAVLRVLRFDVSVSHPHRSLVVVVNYFYDGATTDGNDDDEGVRKRKDELVRRGWRVLNDASFHAAALRHAALSLSCGALWIAMTNCGDDGTSEIGSGAAARALSMSETVRSVVCRSNERLDVSELDKLSSYYGFPSLWWRIMCVSDTSLRDTVRSLWDAMR